MKTCDLWNSRSLYITDVTPTGIELMQRAQHACCAECMICKYQSLWVLWKATGITVRQLLPSLKYSTRGATNFVWEILRQRTLKICAPRQPKYHDVPFVLLVKYREFFLGQECNTHLIRPIWANINMSGMCVTNSNCVDVRSRGSEWIEMPT